MNRLIEFFAMGGYASYVWCAYGMTALVVFHNFMRARKRRKVMLEKTRQWLGKASR